MKNKEKFKDKIVDIACGGDLVAVDKYTYEPTHCTCISCENCLIYNGSCCSDKIIEWANQEYKEPIVISYNDRLFIDFIKADYEYISRDKSGALYAYASKPKKYEDNGNWIGDAIAGLYRFNVDLPMIKWSDKHPWKISVLKNLKVVGNY